MDNPSNLKNFFYHSSLPKKIQTLNTNEIDPDFSPWKKKVTEIRPILNTQDFQEDVTNYVKNKNIHFDNKKLTGDTMDDVVDILCKWHLTRNLKQEMLVMFTQLFRNCKSIEQCRNLENLEVVDITQEFDILWEQWKTKN